MSDPSSPGSSRLDLSRGPRLTGPWTPWVGLLLLAAWTALPSPWWLAAATPFLLHGLLYGAGPRPRLRAVGLLLSLAAVVAGLWAHHELGAIRGDWGSYWGGREDRVFARLDEELDGVLDRGERAALELAELAGSSEGAPEVERVRSIRRALGFPAAAIYGAQGELLAWDGTHQGRVPEVVQRGDSRYMYGELPLFSYLYFTEPVPSTGGTAVVAALLRAELPRRLRAETDDLVSRLSRQTGESLRIGRVRSSDARIAFDFIWDDGVARDTLFSVAVNEPTPEVRADRVRRRWVRVLGLLVALSWLLLALAGRDRPGHGVRAGGTLVGLAVLLPLGPMLGDPTLFGAAYLLPGPVPVSLGRLLALAVGAVALAAVVRRSALPRWPSWMVALVVGVAFPVVVWVVQGGTSPGLLVGEEEEWVAYQLALALLLALVAAGALGSGPGPPEGDGEEGRSRPGRLASALGVALALSAASAWWVQHDPWASTAAWSGLWAAPAFLAAWGLSGWRGWRRSLAVWALAGVLGASAALPQAWSARMEARIAVASERMDRLGAEVDPFLHFLLLRAAERVQELDREGTSPVELLYGGWVDSGIAQEGYPLWLTLWTGSDIPVPDEELRIGVADERPPVAFEYVPDARTSGVVEVRTFRFPDAHYLLTVPLTRGRVVTAVVPPRKDLGGPSPFGPLFGMLAEGGRNPLTLVPLLEGDVPDRSQELRWSRTPEGWRGEMGLEYPGERYHAHYTVDLAGPLVVTARATLLGALDVGVLVLAWLLGVGLLAGRRLVGGELRPLVTSFRARVTFALFAFFLLSNAIFGTLAYRTIAGAAERAAEVLAERIVQDASGLYLEVSRSMELLAIRVGTDVLEYRQGELREGSTEELVELGLYEGWLPYGVHTTLAGSEDLTTTRHGALGRWEHVTAYRRLPDADILAAPVSLEEGATAVRRREVAHLLGFAVVAGGLLSLALAFLVGRTLTQPINTLQEASEQVGRGNLGVRISGRRTDEFGAVFSAFNRMVRRLRGARRDLVRTTRRTQAIVEEAATGVVALDPTGRVTLVNRRAVELLGRDIEVGEELVEAGHVSDELARWLDLYFRDGLREAGTEFQFGEQRLRVRARRISREGPLGGAVVSVEDVTDELRTERVLAWGEMARQVAHEVKNPLTPIKLSIQHIRRAFEDRRPDFGDILERNAEAALREIDRLATIASSFSRFAAPQAAGQAPLEPVPLVRVVSEVLTLYDTAEGAIRFERDLPPSLPPVRARVSEVKEVLVNLLENARAAIETEGTVRVEAETTPRGVLLRVRDDGSGVPDELVPRIFEPHFSTRSAGTGLGLAIVRRLVESWDAAITVESREGEGTVVNLWMSRWSGPEDPDPAADAPPRS